MNHARDLKYLDMAARHAVRAFGNASPNPMVGCVIVRHHADSRPDEILGIGHHRIYADLHAEREALACARRHAHDVRGSTMYVTLEPCSHTGKQPPCTQAILDSGVGEVVIACRDPGELSGGGASVLRNAGIVVRFVDAARARLAGLLGHAFELDAVHGRPFVISKWAQTLDGRSATRTGESQWISNEASRRRVHAWRGRLDAIMVGIGTVLADNPRLTARGVRARRRAFPVVIDPGLKTPIDAALLESGHPVCVVTTPDAPVRDAELSERGATVLRVPADPNGHPHLALALRELRSHFNVTNVMVEGGPRLHGALLDAGLVDALLVYVAPMLLADPEALPAAVGRVGGVGGVGGQAPRLADATGFRLGRVRRVVDDLELFYVREPSGLTNASES